MKISLAICLIMTLNLCFSLSIKKRTPLEDIMKKKSENNYHYDKFYDDLVKLFNEKNTDKETKKEILTQLSLIGFILGKIDELKEKNPLNPTEKSRLEKLKDFNETFNKFESSVEGGNLNAMVYNKNPYYKKEVKHATGVDVDLEKKEKKGY